MACATIASVSRLACTPNQVRLSLTATCYCARSPVRADPTRQLAPACSTQAVGDGVGGHLQGHARLVAPVLQRGQQDGDAVQVIDQLRGAGERQQLPLGKAPPGPHIGAVLHRLRDARRERCGGVSVVCMVRGGCERSSALSRFCHLWIVRRLTL